TGSTRTRSRSTSSPPRRSVARSGSTLSDAPDATSRRAHSWVWTAARRPCGSVAVSATSLGGPDAAASPSATVTRTGTVPSPSSPGVPDAGGADAQSTSPRVIRTSRAAPGRSVAGCWAPSGPLGPNPSAPMLPDRSVSVAAEPLVTCSLAVPSAYWVRSWRTSTRRLEVTSSGTVAVVAGADGVLDGASGGSPAEPPAETATTTTDVASTLAARPRRPTVTPTPRRHGPGGRSPGT